MKNAQIKVNNQVVVNQLTAMPVLPERMRLNADNQPMVTNIKVVTQPTYSKQVPRK